MGRLSIIFITTLLTAACAKGRGANDLGLVGSTNYFSPSGADYIHQGDAHIQRRQQEPIASLPSPNLSPSTSPTPAPQDTTKASLKARVHEFQITRFDVEPTPKRFGRHRVEIKVFLKGEPTLIFKAPFTQAGTTLAFDAVQGDYRMKGELNDFDVPSTQERSQGVFFLYDLKTKETLEISYRAHRSKITLRTDRHQQIVPGSTLDQHLKSFANVSFGWEHNWVVLSGPSFFLVDAVTTTLAHNQPIFTIKGASLRTGEQTHAAEVVKGPDQQKSEARLIGNSETEPSRWIAIPIQDEQTKETSEIIVDVKTEAPPQVSSPEKHREPIIYGPDEDAPPTPAEPKAPNAPSAPKKVKTPPLSSGQEFLRTDLSIPRARRMVQDFNQNIDNPGVRTMIANYQDQWRRDLQNFYDHANPFRPMLEKISQAFGISPVYAYLTVVESPYFTGGNYQVVRNRPLPGKKASSALGPFQLLSGTGQSLGMRVGGGKDDERRYFATSACAAARYNRKIVDMFIDLPEGGDATVAILGYYQGEGGAAAAIYCAYHKEQAGKREACSRRIGSFSGSEYERFIRLADNFKFSYAEMDRMAALPKAMREYVNKKLAIHLISANMKRYNFSLSRNAEDQLPTNGTVFPEKPIADDVCREAIQSLTGS